MDLPYTGADRRLTLDRGSGKTGDLPWTGAAGRQETYPRQGKGKEDRRLTLDNDRERQETYPTQGQGETGDLPYTGAGGDRRLTLDRGRRRQETHEKLCSLKRRRLTLDRGRGRQETYPGQ